MDRLAVGRIGAPHGVDGRLKVVSFSGEIDHLLSLTGAELRQGERTMSVRFQNVRPNGDGVLIKVEGYDSPEKARELSGFELWVERKYAAPLEEGQYYFADLVGCSLVSGDKVLASVVAVCEGGNGTLLEVSIAAGGSSYVPFRNEFVGAVDIKARRIELLAPWILE